ncbi:MAG: FHA domain-containing protein [Chloroflexi bacterium]|nr:FHA domain-containing protein [Chloroflexota bacterium]
MALLVSCPCGNPLDCDHLELVVALSCPKCERELTIEAEDDNDRSYHAVLTVVEGPYWVGEQFVMPLGEDLTLGKGQGNWLSLESDVLAEKHCRLRFSPPGGVEIEDLSTESGTWVGQSSVVKSRLDPDQFFRVGEYRFKLEFQDAFDNKALSQASATPSKPARLPALARIETGTSLTDRLVTNRFQIARRLVLSFAWISAVYHFCVLQLSSDDALRGYEAFFVGLAILGALSYSGRHVTLAHRYLKFLSLAVLVTLAITDIVGARPLPAICALVLASILPLFTTLVPSRVLAVFAVLLGTGSTMVLAILALNSTLALVAQ